MKKTPKYYRLRTEQLEECVAHWKGESERKDKQIEELLMDKEILAKMVVRQNQRNGALRTTLRHTLEQVEEFNKGNEQI